MQLRVWSGAEPLLMKRGAGGAAQNQEDSEWQRKQDAWKAQEEAWKAEQDRRAGEEASWKGLQEARHAETQSRKMSEDARREMELKWKAAQEAWKVRAACRADPYESFTLVLRQAAVRSVGGGPDSEQRPGKAKSGVCGQGQVAHTRDMEAVSRRFA